MQADGEQRGVFIKRKYQQIKSPPPRSESVRKLSRRYRKDREKAVHKASPLLVSEGQGKGEGTPGKSSNTLLHHITPLLHGTMNGTDDGRDVTESLPRSPVLQAKVNSTDDNIEAVGPLPRSSPVLSKKPPFFDLSPLSSPQSSPMLKQQLTDDAPVHKSPTAWKKFGKTLSVDVADIALRPETHQSWSQKDAESSETDLSNFT